MRIHLGCGRRYLPGYLHVDMLDLEHVDYVLDITQRLPFDNQTVDEIYGCHVAEHIPRNSIESTLQDWYRVLKPGGILRLAVPDFEAVVSHYNQNHNLEILLGLLYGRQNHGLNYHYCIYDFQSITDLLTKIGFTDVQRYLWQDFLPKDFDDYSRSYLPHLDFEHGQLMSLNVTAQKPKIIH